MIRRCCKDTLRWRVADLRGPLVEGTEIPCRWCDAHWTFTDGQWTHRDELDERITALVESLPAHHAFARLIAEQREKARKS